MHLDHLKTSHLNGLGPLEPLEWPKKRFHLSHCHQLCLTKETRINILLELLISFFACFEAGNALGLSQNIPPYCFRTIGATGMAKVKICPQSLPPVMLNEGDQTKHIIGLTNFFLCLFQGWQCTWIISKHPNIMFYDHWSHWNGQRTDFTSVIATSYA